MKEYLAERYATSAEHRERAKAADARWRAANPERKSANNAKYRVNNPDVCRLVGVTRRARESAVVKIRFTAEQLAQRWAYYGGKCWVGCGRVATETDHVKPISKGGAHMLCNLRPICKSCNCSKRDTWPFMSVSPSLALNRSGV